MLGRLAAIVLGLVLTACSSSPPEEARPSATIPTPAGELDGTRPVVVGDPIDVGALSGRIVFDDGDDLYVMRADGSDVRRLTDRPGPEFDGAWAPDGRRVVYRDSRRGINRDDEIYVTDGTNARNISRNPANDWGPDWSPDGQSIVFNSDRHGLPMSGYVVSPDGSDLRRLRIDAWVEYPAFSPDGASLAFMAQVAGDYEIYVADLRTGEATRLTDSIGTDGWPAWSPNGTMIAFASERDDCQYASREARCWVTGEPGDHHDIWMMAADGTGLRRVTPEFGHFVKWSPDGRYLLVSGTSLYVIRPDGTGRANVTSRSGGIPDWTA